MAIFTQKPTSPGFPYPEAAPGMGWKVAYPVSGPAQQSTNPYGRSVISRTSTRGQPLARPLLTGPLYTAPAPPWMRRQQIYRWLASYWAHTLSGAQQTLWDNFLLTANASATPPASWRFGTLLKNGFQFFIFYNTLNELLVQNQFGPINPALAPPFPSPPAAWTPPTISSFSAAINSNMANTRFTYTLSAAAQVWITIYLTIPGRTNTLFIQPQALRTWWGNQLPGQLTVGSDAYLFAFGIPTAGTKFTALCRANDQLNNSPSHLFAAFATSV